MQNSKSKPFLSSQENYAQIRLKLAEVIFKKIPKIQRQIRQSLQVFARLDPDGHGLVDLLDGLVMLPLDLGSVASGRKVSI